MEQLYRQTIEKTQTLECYEYRVIELWECEYDKKYKEDRSFDEWWTQNLLIWTLLDQEMHCLVAEPIRRGYTMKLTQGLKMKSSRCLLTLPIHLQVWTVSIGASYHLVSGEHRQRQYSAILWTDQMQSFTTKRFVPSRVTIQVKWQVDVSTL